MPLLVGGSLYLLYREQRLLMFTWIKTINGEEYLKRLRELLIFYNFELDDWIIYSLPNALWLYSLLSFINGVWKPYKVTNRLLLIITFFGIILIEYLQKVNWITGTYCSIDLLLIIIIGLLFISIHKI